MKCISINCENEAIEKQLPFVSKEQFNDGFKVCQECWDRVQKHNLEELIETLKKKIMKFYREWQIIDIDFVNKEIIKEFRKL